MAVATTTVYRKAIKPIFEGIVYAYNHLFNRAAISALLATTLCNGTLLAGGDGSDEPGFVAPPIDRKPPPAPPRTASSAETLLACCCCPVTPMSRTEAKKPPTPPVLVTKLMDGGQGPAQ